MKNDFSEIIPDTWVGQGMDKKTVMALVWGRIKSYNKGKPVVVDRNQILECIAYAASLNLNPLRNQIFFIPRWDKNIQKHNLVKQISIDGYCAITMRTNQCLGWEYKAFYDDDGFIKGARARVKRLVNGVPAVFVSEVLFNEYTTGELLWKEKPHTMICKVALSHALRRAFPEELSGTYTEVEFPIINIERENKLNQSVPVIKNESFFGDQILDDLFGEACKELGFNNIDFQDAYGQILVKIDESKEKNDNKLLEECYNAIRESVYHDIDYRKKMIKKELQDA